MMPAVAGEVGAVKILSKLAPTFAKNNAFVAREIGGILLSTPAYTAVQRVNEKSDNTFFKDLILNVGFDIAGSVAFRGLMSVKSSFMGSLQKQGLPYKEAKSIVENFDKKGILTPLVNDFQDIWKEHRLLAKHNIGGLNIMPETTTRWNTPIIGSTMGEGRILEYKNPRKNEIRGVYNVAFNNKTSIPLQETDVSLFRGNRKWGASHTIKKHLGEGKEGEISMQEFLTIGDVVRNGTEKNIGTRKTYTSLADDGASLKIIVDTKGKDTVEISMFSNRKKENQGGLNNELRQP